MRVLVTGATGFIGRHLAARLAAEHEVIALARRPPRSPIAGVRYVSQDLAAPLDEARLPGRIDGVIHQAALIEAEAAPDDALPFLVNVVATWRLLNYARRAGAHLFLHASTGGVYGCGNRPFVEEDPLNPMDLYSLTKSQAELAVQHTPTDFPKIILRYFFPYGPGTPNPIPHYVRRALRGEPIRLRAGHGPRLNPIHITDAVEATMRCLAPGQDMVLNIAGTEVTTFAAIAELAAAQVGRRPVFETIPDSEVLPYYRADLVADISRMQRTLGFTPQVALAAGIAELADAELADRAG
ncbi:MAG TPA: NAD(P)-dependent oxidoreductase [Caldilineaceae bacterium]|nr:NAD(P)-dependent oxidoreductase [Caldilineaceae bacterium]